MGLRDIYFSYTQALDAYKALQKEYESVEKGLIYARKMSDIGIKISKLQVKLNQLGKGKLVKVTAQDQFGFLHYGFIVGLDENEAKLITQIRYPHFNYIKTDILVSGVLLNYDKGKLIEPLVL